MKIGYLNFYMSALRNMFLTSSIAIAMLGFTDKFTKSMNRRIIGSLSIAIIVLSISFGIKSTMNFNVMLEHTSNEKNLTPAEKILLNQAKEWPIFA